MRQVDRATDVAASEELGASHIEKDEPTSLEGDVNVPAVGLDLEQAAEMLSGLGGAERGNFSHWRAGRKNRHVDLLWRESWSLPAGRLARAWQACHVS